ncbi:MAG: hypothetical protein EOO20_09395 [Chryseobacterium sp.]|uniref:NAD(P)H-dependent oxidoreductase n=1 Tax=Pedobacter agri TaxID=454586 RepID=UPI0011FBCDED|nr:NAD(P)H-dependent oxidoreductase [Pedobacter agri]RZJ90015.1 MAG: hypothetical protein EOO20_09395 [Chryseobacterium sp.]
MKQILILNGDTDKKNSTDFLIEAYKKGAESAGAAIKVMAISDLIFNSNMLFSNRQIAELEPDLNKALQAIHASHHLVLFCPVYVEYIPAKIKGFFDRLFVPEQLFKSSQLNFNNEFRGKSGRIVSILDEHTFKEWKLNKRTTYLSIKKTVLEKRHISPVLTNTIGELHSFDNHYSQKWSAKMEKFGTQLI